MKTNGCIACLCTTLFLIAGCSSPEGPGASFQLGSGESEQIQQLQTEMEQLQRENQQLQEQLEELMNVPVDQATYVTHVDAIDFGRFTRIDDQDQDGVGDQVTVYLLLKDQQGDRIKAAGQVRIELWDLSNGNARLVLSQDYSAKELGGYWLSGFMTDHYKWTLPLPKPYDIPPENLTLKLRFTDILTGRTFEIQKLLSQQK